MGTVKQEEQLERIADALEETNRHLAMIASSITSMSADMGCIERNINNCMSEYKGDYYFRIAGDVYTN